jgi:hypothetical protein
MDYYQKYQKYKFKYLNLLSLNQSGGYKDDEFKIMLENTDVNGYLVEKLAICPLSDNIVHKDHAVLIESAVYDFNYLLKFFISYLTKEENYIIKPKRTKEENYIIIRTKEEKYIINPKIPHNNGRFTEKIYLKILSKVLINNLDHEIMLENTDVNGYLVEKLAICPISQDIVHKDHAVLIEEAIYDVNSLLKFFISHQKRKEEDKNYIFNPKIPHNNGRFTQEIYFKILSKVLKNNLDHKIIFKMSSESELIDSILDDYITYNTIITDNDTINFFINYLIDYLRINSSRENKYIEFEKKIMYEILQLRNLSEDIQQRILKLEYKYRTRLLSFYNPDKIIYILNNLVDDDIKKLFDDNNNNPYDLYGLNMSELETYINNYK